MMKKITGTIVTIVFVALMGMLNASAVEYGTVTCNYTPTDTETESCYIKFEISDGEIVKTDYKCFNANDYKMYDQSILFDLEEYTVTKESDCPKYFAIDYNRDGTGQTTGSYTLHLSNNENMSNELVRPGLSGKLSSTSSEEKHGLAYDKYSCGNGYIKSIPKKIVSTSKILYTAIQILIPIALIIFGMLDLTKAVMAQKEDEIKKGQQTFIKRLVTAAIVFFVFAIVKLTIGVVADKTDGSKIIDCVSCFLQGKCD